MENEEVVANGIQVMRREVTAFFRKSYISITCELVRNAEYQAHFRSSESKSAF